MPSKDDVIVRWLRPRDEHGESVVRAADWWPHTRPNRHLHWPAPTFTDPVKQYPPLVAEIEGKVVGRVFLEAICPPFGELQNMSVLPEFRGRGAGSALVDECVSRLARKGFLAAFLQTGFDNLAAQRLYARKGFTVAARGVMLRLVRFINLPILDRFFYDHPLALHHGPADAGPRKWPLVWSD